MKKTVLALLYATVCTGVAQAEMIKVNGEGSSPINKKDAIATRNQAFAQAKTDAVIALIKKINGPQAMQDAEPFLADIVKQIDNRKTIKNSYKVYILIALLLLGAVTPFHEIHRTIVNSEAGEYTIYSGADINVIKYSNFGGIVQDSDFYKYIIK